MKIYFEISRSMCWCKIFALTNNVWRVFLKKFCNEIVSRCTQLFSLSTSYIEGHDSAKVKTNWDSCLHIKFNDQIYLQRVPILVFVTYFNVNFILLQAPHIFEKFKNFAKNVFIIHVPNYLSYTGASQLL